MWKTAFIGFISAIIGGLIVFYTIVVPSHGELTKLEDKSTTVTKRVSQVFNSEKSIDGAFSARDIYKQFGSGVVHIKSTFTRERTDFFGFRLPPEQLQAGGSGFIIDGSGIIITNAHVVQDSNTIASSITVVLSDSEEVGAKLLGTDPSTDIAVLKIDPGHKALRVLKLGDSSILEVGDTVYAIGSPFELEGTMTEGIVSALNRTIDSPNPNFMIRGVIQTDAAVNPGNSGGPLINSAGEVIGINSQIASSSGSFAGIAFAIPSNTVKTIASQIVKTGKAKHAWLGLGGVGLTNKLADAMHLSISRGVLVGQVAMGSPAGEAGIIGANQVLLDDTGQRVGVGGDVIVKIGNENVASMDDVLNYVDRHKIGETVKIQIYRGGKKSTLTIKLEERPQEYDS